MIKIAILVLLLITAWISLRSLEPRTLYYPDRTMIAKPSVYRLAYEDVHLVAADGTKIHGWYIPAAKERVSEHASERVSGRQAPSNNTHSPTRSPAYPRKWKGGQLAAPTFLFCHGNAGNISHRLDKLAKYHALGINVLIFDYRGYGRSEGRPSELGTYRDAEAAYQWIVHKPSFPRATGGNPSMAPPPETAGDDARNKIVFYGESLGCAVAVEMAIRHPDAAGLILESPFTSTVAMAKRIFPWLPVKWIVRYRYDNLSKIPKIKMPLLILHSPQDEIVPFAMGQELFAAAPEPKRLVEMVGGHNDGYLDFGERYLAVVKRFLKSLPVRPPASGGLR